MNVIIFGATGGVGMLAVQYALAKGQHVTAYVRTVDKMNVSHDALNVVQGDVLNKEAVSAAISGHDAVICAIGGGTTNLVRANGTKQIIAGMVDHDVKRLIVVSSMGVGDSERQLGMVAKFFINTVIKKAIEDHALQEKYVMATDLVYTIVRPGGLGNDQLSDAYVVTDDNVKVNGGRVSRADVADFCVQLLDDEHFNGRAVSIVGKQPHLASYSRK